MHLVLAPEPDSSTTGLSWLHRAAEGAEQALFDAVIAPLPGPDVPAEPSTLLASLVTATNRIGLVAPVSTERVAPYNRARYLSTLDHLSVGRAGWILDAGENQDRAAEFVSVLRQLWVSWAPDAVRADAEAGVYVDNQLLHPIQHEGLHFAVEGPLNLPRSPQVHPPLLAYGQSAGYADVAVVADGSRPAGASLVLRERRLDLGNPAEVASALAADVRSGGVDGYVLHLTADDMVRFGQEVTPRLQDAGLVRTHYETSMLRGHLGLPVPVLEGARP